MAVLILKLLTDGFWYLSAVVPVMGSAPLAVRAGLLAVPCVYGIWLIMNRRRRDFIGNAQDVFLFEGKTLAVVTVFELVILGSRRWQTLCAPFMMAFLLCGILLMRISRVSEAEQRQPRFWGLNGLCLLPVMAGALVLSSGAVRNVVGFLLGNTYHFLILPILLGILQLFLLIVQILVSLFSGIFPQLSGISAEMGMVELDTDTRLDLEGAGVMEIPLYAKVLGIALGLAVAGALLFLIYRRIADSTFRKEERRVSVTERSRIPEAERSERDSRIFGREKNVRYYYRKFLKLCRERGILMERSMTSEEIGRLARRFWSEEDLKELRDLYLQSRYGFCEEKDGQRQQAREIYRKLKKEEPS